ncbi:MAG: hypothetical protein ABI351_12090 [Herbaspirillum sp.]
MMITPCRLDSVRGILSRAITAKTGGVGRFDLDDLNHGAVCMQIQEDDGEVVAAYLLKAEGKTLWVRAAAGRSVMDLCDVLDAAITHQAQNFERIGFQTRRAGLIKKASDRGYQVTGIKDGFTAMEKSLT